MEKTGFTIQVSSLSWNDQHLLKATYIAYVPGLEIDNEVKNNLIFNVSRKSTEFLHLITKIKSREYRSIDNVKSILFSDSVNSDSVNAL